MHCVIIGAGIVGVTTGLSLLKQGHKVTFVEPMTPGGEQAASYGNGAWISPGSVVPMSFPGLWKKVPSYLLDPHGPLTIRWQNLPSLLPWLLRFVLAGSTVAKMERTSRILNGLLADAPARHRALAEEAGRPDMIRQDGLLYAYPDRAAFAAESLSWHLRRLNGLEWIELEGEALRQHEPAIADRYGFAAFIPAGAHCIDPGGYVAVLMDHAKRLGAEYITASATGFEITHGVLKAVLTTQGPITCDRAVIAAGIHSKALAKEAGDHVSLASERGYHVVVDGSMTPLRSPIMPSDGKMANTLTTKGLRASGQVELAEVQAPPNWRRAAILLGHLQKTYPALPRFYSADQIQRWMGHRPSTPDGLPVIGPSSACAEIVHAFGHGHVGFASGPKTAELVTHYLTGSTPSLPLAPFSASRFR